MSHLYRLPFSPAERFSDVYQDIQATREESSRLHEELKQLSARLHQTILDTNRQLELTAALLGIPVEGNPRLS